MRGRRRKRSPHSHKPARVPLSRDAGLSPWCEVDAEVTLMSLAATWDGHHDHPSLPMPSPTSRWDSPEPTAPASALKFRRTLQRYSLRSILLTGDATLSSWELSLPSRIPPTSSPSCSLVSLSERCRSNQSGAEPGGHLVSGGGGESTNAINFTAGGDAVRRAADQHGAFPGNLCPRGSPQLVFIADSG